MTLSLCSQLELLVLREENGSSEAELAGFVSYGDTLTKASLPQERQAHTL